MIQKKIKYWQRAVFESIWQQNMSLEIKYNCELDLKEEISLVAVWEQVKEKSREKSCQVIYKAKVRPKYSLGPKTEILDKCQHKRMNVEVMWKWKFYHWVQ